MSQQARDSKEMKRGCEETLLSMVRARLAHMVPLCNQKGAPSSGHFPGISHKAVMINDSVNNGKGACNAVQGTVML